MYLGINHKKIAFLLAFAKLWVEKSLQWNVIVAASIMGNSL